jgi:5-formyltetrahydrofolate cyclo-ligase
MTAHLRSDLDTRKRALRAEAADRRTKAHAVHKSIAPLSLARTGLDFAELPSGLIVSGFFPFKSEIDVLPLLARLNSEGWTTSLPIVLGEGRPLVFRQWAPGEETVPGIWDIPMPVPEAPEVEPDVLLVPLLAFDAKGFRLGYGGGYYDRTLTKLRKSKPVTAIGVCYLEQEVANVPHGPSDELLDYVLTPSGPRKCG